MFHTSLCDENCGIGRGSELALPVWNDKTFSSSDPWDRPTRKKCIIFSDIKT